MNNQRAYSSQNNKQSNSNNTEIKSQREDRVLSLFNDYLGSSRQDEEGSRRYFKPKSNNNFQDVNQMLRLIKDGDKKAFNLGIQTADILNADSRVPTTFALLGNVAVFLTSLYILYGSDENKVNSLMKTMSSGTDSLMNMIFAGEMPDLGDLNLPENFKLPEGMQLPQLPPNIKMPAPLQNMLDKLNLSQQQHKVKPGSKPSSKLPTLPPVIIIPPIHSADFHFLDTKPSGKRPFYQFPINNGDHPKTVLDFMTGYKYKIPTNAISLGYNTPPPHGYKKKHPHPAPPHPLPPLNPDAPHHPLAPHHPDGPHHPAPIAPLDPHAAGPFPPPGVLPGIKHHGKPVHPPHHTPVAPLLPLPVVPAGPGALPEHGAFQHFPVNHAQDNEIDHYPFLKDPTPHPVGSIPIHPAITLDHQLPLQPAVTLDDLPTFVDLTGGNPIYAPDMANFFLKTIQEGGSGEVEMEGKSSEENAVTDVVVTESTELPDVDEEQITTNTIQTSTDIGEVIDLTESDGTDEHNQASPNFMKGMDLYEKYKMKKNKKYLYKLLQEAAMTTTTKPAATITNNSKMNFQKEIETNIESTNTVRDRYDSSYMDEILMMTGFESIKVPGAQFGRNTFALKSRGRDGGDTVLGEEFDPANSHRTTRSADETTTTLDTLVITL